MRRVATSVTWSRIDLPSPATPSRYVTSIYVDPADGNHAWVSYSGYNVNAPGGHLFEVQFNPATGTATWTNIDHNWGDLPVSDLVYDDVTGDLYASSDFGVSKLEDGHDELGARRVGDAEGRGSRPDHRARRAQALRGHARAQCLVPQPAGTTMKYDSLLVPRTIERAARRAALSLCEPPEDQVPPISLR